MALRKLTTNFTSGELDEGLHGRTDLPLYANGAARLRNLRPLPGGGVRRRAGTQYCAEKTLGDYQHNEWIFNSSQTYQLLFGHQHVSIHDGVTGELLETLGGAPWTVSLLRTLSVYCQGDFAFICHPGIPTMQVRRIGTASFVLEQFAYARTISGGESPIWQPYHRYVAGDVPIRVQAITGYTHELGYQPGATAQLQCFAAPFEPAHVGTFFEIGNSQWEITAYGDPTTLIAALRTANFRLPLVENPMTMHEGLHDVSVYDPFHDFIVGSPVTVIDATPFQQVSFRQLNGMKTITAVDASNWYYTTNLTGTDPVNEFTSTGGGPNVQYWSNFVQTVDWKEQMYSQVRGWPHCVSGFQTRLIFGGGRDAPNRVNFSRVEAPFNFDPGTGQDDDAILVGISGRRTPVVTSVVGAQHVQIFTSEGEYYIPTVDNNASLTPSTISIKPQTFYGIQDGLPAVEFDGATLFVSKNGSHLRQLVFAQDGYTASDLSFVAHHLMPSPLWLAVQMEDADQAAATALVVDRDGTIANLTMMRSEKIAAWASHNTQGAFYSACAVNERAFFMVRRIVGGVAHDFLEKLDRSRMLDCSRMGIFSHQAGSTYVWGGFNHLAGQEVSVVIDGVSDIGLYTVDENGLIFIDVRASFVEAGFGFATEITTLPPEIVLQDGPSPGEPRRVVSAALRLKDSYAVKVRGNKLIRTTGESDLGLAVPAFSGTAYVPLLGWDTSGQVAISQYGNAPMTLLSVNLELEF